jgi:hypothetical protein
MTTKTPFPEGIKMPTNTPESAREFASTRIIERPDGFFWLDPESDKMFGPFDTLAQAVEDMEYNAESNYEPDETIEEAERELGLANWVDTDTGELAEDTLTRIEDH